MNYYRNYIITINITIKAIYTDVIREEWQEKNVYFSFFWQQTTHFFQILT